MADFFAHPTAIIDKGATIGSGSRIWHFAHIFPDARIGKNCSFGQNTMVADGTVIGNNVKVQNNVTIYSGTTIEDDVFLGPSCVLTNVSNPRSQVVRRGIYESTVIRRGATVGANATIVCNITLGRYCFIAAGAVATRDVDDYSMIAGVPGQPLGWMSRHGHRLQFNEDAIAICPESQLRYQISTSQGQSIVRCLDLDEEEPLPDDLTVGKTFYPTYKSNS